MVATKQLEQFPADSTQALAHLGLGQVRAGGTPVADCGQAPALGFIGEAADQHPQQARAPIPLAGWPFQPQLHQQGSALQPGTPARKVEGEIQGFTFLKSPGQGVVAPGLEVGAGVREMLAKQAGHRGNGLGQFQGSGLIGGVHALHPGGSRTGSSPRSAVANKRRPPPELS